jgi:hypothetical protein
MATLELRATPQLNFKEPDSGVFFNLFRQKVTFRGILMENFSRNSAKGRFTCRQRNGNAKNLLHTYVLVTRGFMYLSMIPVCIHHTMHLGMTL